MNFISEKNAPLSSSRSFAFALCVCSLDPAQESAAPLCCFSFSISPTLQPRNTLDVTRKKRQGDSRQTTRPRHTSLSLSLTLFLAKLAYFTVNKYLCQRLRRNCDCIPHGYERLGLLVVLLDWLLSRHVGKARLCLSLRDGAEQHATRLCYYPHLKSRPSQS